MRTSHGQLAGAEYAAELLELEGQGRRGSTMVWGKACDQPMPRTLEPSGDHVGQEGAPTERQEAQATSGDEQGEEEGPVSCSKDSQCGRGMHCGASGFCAAAGEDEAEEVRGEPPQATPSSEHTPGPSAEVAARRAAHRARAAEEAARGGQPAPDGHKEAKEEEERQAREEAEEQRAAAKGQAKAAKAERQAERAEAKAAEAESEAAARERADAEEARAAARAAAEADRAAEASERGEWARQRQGLPRRGAQLCPATLPRSERMLLTLNALPYHGSSALHQALMSSPKARALP